MAQQGVSHKGLHKAVAGVWERARLRGTSCGLGRRCGRASPGTNSVKAQTSIGVISDTHGLLRPQAVAALRGSDLIVHAGDVGHPSVLEALEGVAPVVAVRGNNDCGAWAERLPATKVLDVAGLTLCLLHDLGELEVDPVAMGFKAVIAGHSHQPKLERRGGVLYLNPGSAGPRRFKLPVCLARIRVHAGRIEAELIELAL